MTRPARVTLSLCLLLGGGACFDDIVGPGDAEAGILTGNVDVREVTVASSDAGGRYRTITFDVAWGHSWRRSEGPANWDAAWIFVKFRVGSGEWRHATLSSGAASHRVPQGVALDVPADGRGVFLFRNDPGSGEFRASDVSLRWESGADGVAADASVDVRVFGLPMVYIPEGPLFAGDNGASGASLTRGSGDNRPWPVTGEGAIEVTDVVANGFYYRSSRDVWSDVWNAGEDLTGASFTIPAAFPKGFRAIYSMRYELTQQQYADFLNTLTPAQAANRYDPLNYGKFGYTIQERGGVFSTAHPERACGFLSPADGFAYADWAGLRPMSELEFEKIARGSGNSPVAGEYAWGTTYLRNAVSVAGDETDRTRLTSLGANSFFLEAGYQPQFPLNAGIFFEVGKTRERSGATYYGVLEMSGNLNETCVSVGSPYGRTFTYRNGDGRLSADGFADEGGWPQRDGKGAGYRGGTLAREGELLRLSDRSEAAVEIDAAHRHIPWGFRGVRTAQ